MTTLYNKQTGENLGMLSEEQLRFLIEQMEEENMTDQDYAITPMTVTYLEQRGADPALLAMLRQALGGRDEVTVAWREG